MTAENRKGCPQRDRAEHEGYVGAQSNDGQEAAEQGYTQAVMADLSKYFDTLNHDLLMKLMRKNIHDKRVIELVKESTSESM